MAKLVRFGRGPAAVTLSNGQYVERGVPAEVDDERAEKLVAQGWEIVRPSRQKTSVEKKSKSKDSDPS